MIQIHKILVPTDFSDEVSQALPYAIDLARATGAEILLAHVQEFNLYPSLLGIGPVLLPAQNEQLRERIANALEHLRKKIPASITSRTTVREGNPHRELVQLARDEAVDLIVIATCGHTGVKHVMLGSTAERVVREAPCPVLAVRAVASSTKSRAEKCSTSSRQGGGS